MPGPKEVTLVHYSLKGMIRTGRAPPKNGQLSHLISLEISAEPQHANAVRFDNARWWHVKRQVRSRDFPFPKQHKPLTEDIMDPAYLLNIHSCTMWPCTSRASQAREEHLDSRRNKKHMHGRQSPTCQVPTSKSATDKGQCPIFLQSFCAVWWNRA